MPLIVVVLPGAHCATPEVVAAPPMFRETNSPLPPVVYTGAGVPLVPPVLGVGLWPEPAFEVMPLSGLLEPPQAIEPTSATPMHKENGMVFIWDFLRSIGCDTRGGAFAAHAQLPSADQ